MRLATSSDRKNGAAAEDVAERVGRAARDLEREVHDAGGEERGHDEAHDLTDAHERDGERSRHEVERRRGVTSRRRAGRHAGRDSGEPNDQLRDEVDGDADDEDDDQTDDDRRQDRSRIGLDALPGERDRVAG